MRTDAIAIARPVSPNADRAAPPTEAQLLAAFEEARERAYWVALDITKDTGEAADVVQDAHVRARRSLGGFRGDCSLRSWILRITVNLALKALRRRNVRKKLSHLLPERFREPVATPEHLVGAAQQARQLAGALDVLPERQRAAFVLRHAHDMSVAEVAEVLDISTGTVKTHLVRAAKRLRRELKDMKND